MAAADFSADWHAQPPPVDLYATAKRFFRPGRTADIGCGSGREVAWLNANGYPAQGFDPSVGLLTQAEARYPGLRFSQAALPDLAGIQDASFDNVLCATVIMHLPRKAIAPSIRRLMAILRTGGILYLTWRVTVGTDQRDRQGRLYVAFGRDLVIQALAGAAILADAETVSPSSGKAIHGVVARKEPAAHAAER